MSTLTCCGRFFPMGSQCCAVCGSWIPFQQQFPNDTPTEMRPGSYLCCQSCFSLQPVRALPNYREPSTVTSAALLFTKEEINAAQKEVQQRMAAAAKEEVGTTHVDNRVEEEAFCESCGVHRKCKVFARQIRSADEGQTIFYQCTACRAEWQLNS
ncbi:putative transcription factor S-II-like protein [Trypanosoma vivax]|uniref:Putative transcription factor S-II-like protein n=1 Tax=Trypanosoma vivax (strain Y486) TaxID=1055687 RepID=G0UCT4_TRYVY|nr:putative transcription factor S-II-like protein [Trypanosoma vivax]CCC53644.1 putative transcription factor S-II-like protein [Trypanosoma vivax Y486]